MDLPNSIFLINFFQLNDFLIVLNFFSRYISKFYDKKC